MLLMVRLAIRPISSVTILPHRSSRSLLLSAVFALAVPGFAQVLLVPTPPTRFVVVLDAAHGGNDAGGTLKDTSGVIQQEKALTLALSVRLRSLLGARGISVVTTRESDATVD